MIQNNSAVKEVANSSSTRPSPAAMRARASSYGRQFTGHRRFRQADSREATAVSLARAALGNAAEPLCREEVSSATTAPAVLHFRAEQQQPTVSAFTNGLGFCSIAKYRGGRTSGSRRVCDTPNCVTRPASRTSIIAAHADLTAPYSKNSPTANGSMLTIIWRWSVRRASGKAGWHRRSDTKPAATIAPCSITASQSYSRISRWRAATVAIRVSCAISAVPIF